VSHGAGLRAELEALFQAALAAVDPGELVRGALARSGSELRIAGRPLPDHARLVVLAAGKGAAPMAAALEDAAGDRVAAGLVVTKDGYTLPLRRLPVWEAGHPLPDARSQRAARRALELAAGACSQDVLIVLLSGGASALLGCPLPGITPAELATTTRMLLGAGLDIEETNAVRKHLVELAGGRLAQRAACQRIELLAISDVAGDRLDVLGSGPCSPDPSRFADALAALERHGLGGRLPRAVREHLEAGLRGEREETPKPRDPVFHKVHATLLASNRTALEAAGRAARHRGWRTLVVSAELHGEARLAGRRLAALGRAVAPSGRVCLLAGGETTVTLRGSGRGGRSQELALAAAFELSGSAGLALLAAGTDGSDGPTDAAGAFVDAGTLVRAAALGLQARAALDDNDAYGFFDAEGGLLRTGPTRTNVGDLVLLLRAAVPAADRFD
jgi:glycerate-2-kinase